MLGPAEHARLEEGAIKDQLPATLEQVRQADLTIWSLELVLLVDEHPGHPSPLGGQSITRAGKRLFFHQKLLPRGLPFPLGDDWRCLARVKGFPLFFVFFLTRRHLISPYIFAEIFSETKRDHWLEKRL